MHKRYTLGEQCYLSVVTTFTFGNFILYFLRMRNQTITRIFKQPKIEFFSFFVDSTEEGSEGSEAEDEESEDRWDELSEQEDENMESEDLELSS